ncbi:MAG: hypothetical protein JNJ54_25310 [Myxococcaceae bacterium]|nr:hypothetical protein [Myxococcaceae bacterium]
MAPRSLAKRSAPPTSSNLEDFSKELAYAGDRKDLLVRVSRLKPKLGKLLTGDELELVEVSGRAAKKNLAQRLSEAIAQKIANALRREFPGIQPDASGSGHESFSKGAGGVKKLDVNYSTKKSGLELAVSVKTINFADDATGRYTKNVKRVDGELRAEAQDCHKRQPYAVIAAYLFMPIESAKDGANGKSSAKHAAEVLAARSHRKDSSGPHEKVELSFIGLYEDQGTVRFCFPDDVPLNGTPTRAIGFGRTLELLRKEYQQRQSEH